MSEPGGSRTGSSAGSTDDSMPNTNWRAKSVLSRQSIGCPTQVCGQQRPRLGRMSCEGLWVPQGRGTKPHHHLSSLPSQLSHPWAGCWQILPL